MIAHPFTPEQLDTFRQMVAQGHSSRVVAEVFGVNRKTILNAAERFNLGPWRVKSGKPQRPAPDDFAEMFDQLPQRALAEHYGVNRRMIERWARRLDLTSPRRSGPKPVIVKRAPTFIRRLGGTPHATTREITRDMSEIGRAVDYLRRFSAVYRCNERGGAVDKGATHWRRGSAVLTDAELIERAQRLGFDVNSWRKLAA